MKKVMKIFTVILIIVIMTGCSYKMSPKESVAKLLNKYINNDKEIIEELDKYLNSQNLTVEQKQRYKNIVKDEYATIKYNIKKETIDGTGALVEVEIEVKDLYRAEKEAKDYLGAYPTKFYKEEIYDSNKFIDYKLDKMEKADTSIIYTIYINLFLENDKWKVEELDRITLEKIHGLHNYETNPTSS